MKKYGFTLIELSVVLALIGVILYGSMSLLVVGVQTAQVNSTVATMDAIEKALLDFRVAFGRIPCPSDLTATASSVNYGVEAANQGSCTAGSPAANFIAASGTAEGGVPTRALRLSDSYMYDGWGHKFRYAVNPNYTVSTSTSCPLSTNPAITVNDASGAARSTKAIYAIVSQGANGHGAYTSNGVVVNAGSTNANELTNCHCTSTGAANTYSSTYVQKMPTVATAGSPLTAFDDIVAYKEFWQLMTPNLTSNSLGCLYPDYYRTVTIDHTKVSTVNNTDQSSFSVLFSGTYSYLKTVANGGSVNNANGYDITFTSDAAGTHLLPFERESYNATTGAVVFWVQVPTVSHSSDTVIYLHYGNPNITTDQSNKTLTWDSNYMGVWHLDETSGTQYDSTSNGNKTSTVNVTTEGSVTGKIGGADSFNGSSNYLEITGLMGSATTITLSAWGNLTARSSNGAKLISIGNYVNIDLDDTTSSGCGFYNQTQNWWYGPSTAPTYAGTGWHLFACTIDTVNHVQTFYVDGVQNGQTIYNYSLSYTGQGTDTYVGEHGYYGSGWNFNGTIDEIRISKSIRSADWIVTEYNNQSAPDKATYGASGFYTVGAQTSR